jgi:hypothetical protein
MANPSDGRRQGGLPVVHMANRADVQVGLGSTVDIVLHRRCMRLSYPTPPRPPPLQEAPAQPSSFVTWNSIHSPLHNHPLLQLHLQSPVYQISGPFQSHTPEMFTLQKIPTQPCLLIISTPSPPTPPLHDHSPSCTALLGHPMGLPQHKTPGPSPSMHIRGLNSSTRSK